VDRGGDDVGWRGTQAPVDRDGGSGREGVDVVDSGGEEGDVNGGAVGGRRRRRG
jgi:hypothetical protein